MSSMMVIVFLLLLVSGTPIAIVLGATTLLSVVLFTKIPVQMLPQLMFSALDSFTLLAVPMFILTGEIIGSGRTAEMLIGLSKALLGRVAGGLAITTVLACMAFASITGSSLTGIVAIGAIMFPALVKGNYEERFSLGLITSTSSLGIMIPPSIPMIIYALVMGVSVGQLFLAGFGPGILMGLAFMGYSFYKAKRCGWVGEEKPSWSELMRRAKEGIWALLLPIVVLGGIYGGVFTPTEAAGVSVIYAIVVELVLYKGLSPSKLFSVLKGSAVLSGCLLFIFSCGTTFSWLLTSQQIPQRMAEHILGLLTEPWMFLVGVNVLLLAVGCFLDIASAILIFGPIFYPILVGYKIDLIHFGIVMILNLEMGFLTPPVGFNLFVASSVTRHSIVEISRAVLPFLLMMLFCLGLVTYLPSISMLLPNLVFRR